MVVETDLEEIVLLFLRVAPDELLLPKLLLRRRVLPRTGASAKRTAAGVTNALNGRVRQACLRMADTIQPGVSVKGAATGEKAVFSLVCPARRE